MPMSKPDDAVLAGYIDTLIIPLIAKVGLKVQVTRKPEYTTLKIKVRRGDKTG